MNNLPAALLAGRVLQTSDHREAEVFAALLGLNIGPTILSTGSLATLLVLDVARKKGDRLRSIDVIRIGAWVTPIVLLLASLTLAALDR